MGGFGGRPRCVCKRKNAIVAEQKVSGQTTTKEMTCITIIIDIPSALETSLDIHSIPRTTLALLFPPNSSNP
eukprot:scaffold27140_cov78-Skeletonema_dohrnii-CCMP3373.AAC.2